MILFKCFIVWLCLFSHAKVIQAEITSMDGNQCLIESFCSPPENLSFIPLTNYESVYDDSVYQAGIDYFNSQPELISRIRSDLGDNDLNWELSNTSHRLIYAPEDRVEISEWFTHYCRSVIHDLLRETGLDNPYSSMEFPYKDLPSLSSAEGIKVLIVQDLGREYNSQYSFSGKGEQKAMIRISGRILLNEIGSYSSYIQYSSDTGKWEVVRDQHTIWKSRAKNPYSVLLAPVEETLHILLREYTEKAILQTLEKNEETRPDQVTGIVNEWLAIEEAVVGGLVEAVVPDLIGSRFPVNFEQWNQAVLETKSGFEKYRYMDQGIRLVKSMGIRESCQQYAAGPENLMRKLLCENVLSHKK